ncbi:hypothetical protein QVA66_03350 [Staphylococcus chromogenes]|nr:hypothetical protein [Staphylococcus chromogenes]
MRRIALTACTIFSLFTLSGYGLPAVMNALPNNEKTTAQTADAVPPAETAAESTETESTTTQKSKPASTKESSSSSTTTTSSKATSSKTAKSDSQQPEVVEIPAEQQKILKEALVPIIKEYAQNPETDTVTGQIRFDKDMKPINFSKFTVNDKPIGIDAPVRREAEKALEPLTDIPESERFSKLEFKYANNYLESTVHYRD